MGKTYFTWNLKEIRGNDFHLAGPIGTTILEPTHNIRRRRSESPAVLKLKKCSLDYFVVDFVHAPTSYMNNVMPGVIDVIFWLQQNNILTGKTKIEFKNLLQQHVVGTYLEKLQKLKKHFSFSSMNFLESTWGKITQKYYDHLLIEGIDGNVFSNEFGGCPKGKEILQFQLKTTQVLCLCVTVCLSVSYYLFVYRPKTKTRHQK